jgi:phage terminase small subunit
MPQHKHTRSELKSAKQDLFVREYLIDFNGTQAAIRAGYAKRTAKNTAYELLEKPEVIAKIRELIEQRAEKAEITGEKVLKELARIGFSDIRKIMRWGTFVPPTEEGEPTVIESYVELLDSDQLADDDARAIAEVSKSANGVLKVKMYDKRGALVDLGRYIGLFAKREDKNKHRPAKAVIVPAKIKRDDTQPGQAEDQKPKEQPASMVLPMVRKADG